MRRPHSLLERIRPTAGRLLLGLFLLAGQFAPLAHLATHRNDHTHGPDVTSEHEAAHRAGRAHDHDDFDHQADDDADHGHDHDDDHDHAVTRDDHDDTDHDHGGGTPQGPASPDHGRASAAHLDLALLDGPPPPFLPPPAETLAPPPDVYARWHHAPALPQPPARGPPPSH